ncbi:hypothetical protein ACSBR2_021143 [Camellia fascicularis]
MKGIPNPEALSAQMRHAPMGLRIRRLYLPSHDIHDWRSEFGGFIGPKASCADGAPNPRLYLASRDIHDWRSESGGFIGPKASCADGAPNPATLFGQS